MFGVKKMQKFWCKKYPLVKHILKRSFRIYITFAQKFIGHMEVILKLKDVEGRTNYFGKLLKK